MWHVVDTLRITCPPRFASTTPFCSANRKKRTRGKGVAVPKMKASRRASRPAGAPPNNILAPYPALSSHSSPSSSRPPNEAALLSAIRECRWPAGLLLYLLRRHRENAGGGEIADWQERRDRWEKRNERPCRCCTANSPESPDDSTYISVFVISRNDNPSDKKGYTGFLFHRHSADILPSLTVTDEYLSVENAMRET